LENRKMRTIEKPLNEIKEEAILFTFLFDTDK
jgi:hypothetical protein